MAGLVHFESERAVSRLPDMDFLEPREAWEALVEYRQDYYRASIAAYNGDHSELRATSDYGMFWQRAGKAKVHVPIAADIAATSADMLFSEEPQLVCYDEVTEDNESKQQHRLDELIELNNLHGKLNEAAESCAALGDVYLKLNWWQDEVEYPVLTVVQGDSAWPEFLFGLLQCVHFFSIIKEDMHNHTVYRLYERYEKGRIISRVFRGSPNDLGSELPESELEQYGLEADLKTPIDEMLAVHIPNMKPNRRYRDSSMGRSDLDGLRNLMDSLDETYSSWMRDIRLAKARLIVPAEYLRRKPAEMFNGDNRFTYEFDEDIETLVALDIDPERVGTSITPSQFSIRSTDHAMTCSDIIRNIVTVAGYAPQSFGLDIQGMAQSGTALHIREKKSYNTRGKKQTYWKSPLERIMTAMVHLDAVLYPQAGSDSDDNVKIKFADSMSNDISTMSSALSMLNSAAAVSTEMKIQMLHPDWTQKQIAEEVERIKKETGMWMNDAMAEMGDLEGAQAGDGMPLMQGAQDAVGAEETEGADE